MKTSLSLVLMVAAASTLAACSSDEGTPRAPTGAAGTGTGTAGTGAGGTGAGGTGAGGTGTSTAGTGTGTAGTGAGTAFTPGAPIVITPTAVGANAVDSAGESGISGAVILAQSTMQVAATTAHREGALCMSGTTAVVANGDYGTYWGAELSMDLKLVPADGTPAASDAGAGDAGTAPALVREAWPLGVVTGFSFVLEGQDPAGAGIPAQGQIRFKALPTGSDPALDTFCTEFAPASGATVEIGLDQITYNCWGPGNPSLAEDMINVVATPGAVQTQRPNPRTLQTISWAVAATLTTPIPFNFCISDIRPLYAPAP